MIMTKKIYAIIMKKMVKVKNPAGFLENPARGFLNPARGFLNPARGFSPTFSNGGKTPQGFFKKINIKICSRNKFV